MFPKGPLALASAGLLALAAAVVLDRWAPDPSADVARGSDDAFATGLHPRELRPRQPLMRWTRERALFRFRELPGAASRLEVRGHDHKTPVRILVDGLVVGVLEPGAAGVSVPLAPSPRRRLDVELVTEGFLARDGRRLGTALDRVALELGPRGAPAPGLLLGFVGAALAICAAGLACGLRPSWAALLSGGLALLEALALYPEGIVRSPESAVLSLLVALGAGALGLAARWLTRGEGQSSSRPWAFLALMSAFVVQGLAATHPLMVVSDAVFHANMLTRVAAGDFFPTSLTQHKPPFAFPYGVSFYLLLAPLVRLGGDPVVLVRAGAAASGVVASAAAFALLAPAGPRRAALAVLLLQALPETFRVFSYGNLSNVFGQSLTVMFLAWWAGAAPGGFVVGALLFALGALGHFSSFLVLLVLAAALAVGRRASLRSDRTRALGLAMGVLGSVAYYLSFTGLILRQLPRLLEGSGAHAPPAGLPGIPGLTLVLGLLGQWGMPAALLALWGFPRTGESGLERDLGAVWAAGGLLAVLALVSPLDVRYGYALTVVVAAAAAEGVRRLRGRGAWGVGLGALLLAVQGVLCAREVVEDVVRRYRGPL